MKRLLKALWVLQEVSNKNRTHKLGRGFMKARRINPFNPLSYVFIPIAFITGLIMFGIVGFWKEVDLSNPFKWN